MAGLIKRGKVFYAVYYVGGEQKRTSLNTDSRQLAKEKLRKLESALFRDDDNPFPTKSPLDNILEKYLFHLKAQTSDRNVQKVVTYLRGTFGPVSPSLKLRNENVARKAVKRPPSGKLSLLKIVYLEQLNTEMVASYLASLVVYKGISAKTANHYRQNLLTLCNWAKTEGGVRFPGGKNPVDAVKRYKEICGDISFLKKQDIVEQLAALDHYLPLKTMAAVYIYAGLRREEALWLMPSDIDWNAGHYGTIRIRGKEFDGKKWVPKTKTNRTVPISSTLRRYLDEYLAKVKPGTWLFMSPDGCRWDPDNFSITSARSEQEDRDSPGVVSTSATPSVPIWP